jgi:hypothetical protein
MDDRAFLQRIQKWLKAGMGKTDGEVIHPETGTPPGGTRSPGLSNAYVHDVLALWCAQVVRAHWRGEALFDRFAEDWGWACRDQADAERFSRGLPKRGEQGNLQGAPETTRLRRCSRFHPSMQRRGTLLGCEGAWRAERQGVPRVQRCPARKKLPAACWRMPAGTTQHRPLPGREFCRPRPVRVQGHDNYYGVRGTVHSLQRVFRWAIARADPWLNRRGGTRQRIPGRSTRRDLPA